MGEGDMEEVGLTPVIVFLHGGAFMFGSSESSLYGPQVLLDRNVILVTVNYRLGVFGWLSMESETAPGNLGLWDQRLALLWVRDNIAKFGGDPENVSLMGESAGAMCALLHLVAPPSQGLFHRVIALSGTPNCVLLQGNRRPRVFARSLAERLGCRKEADEEEVIQYLREVKADKLLKASLMFLDWDHSFPQPWFPSTDSSLQDPFLPLTFTEAVMSGKAGKVPVILTCCKDEGLFWSSRFRKNEESLSLLARDWDTWAPLLLLGRERDLVNSTELELVREVRDFYWPNGDIGEHREQDLEKLKDIFSMSYFLSPMDTDSKLLATSGFSVYTMLITQETAFSLSTMFSRSMFSVGIMFTKYVYLFDLPKHQGVGHGDDLGFLSPIQPPFFPPMVVTPQQQKTRQTILDLLTCFTVTGKPLMCGDMENVWSCLDPSLGQYLDVGETMKM